MTSPRSDDRPSDRHNPASASPSADSAASGTAPMPVIDTAPPLAPSPEPFREQSPWWSAPSGKPFGIPDFAHEFLARFAALAVASLAAIWADVLAWLFPGSAPVPVPVKARRRR